MIKVHDYLSTTKNENDLMNKALAEAEEDFYFTGVARELSLT